ncbi:uncharacterized protein LOC121976874 [Zingiber officinale]|uniref:uncharacterized protein LOC121976874 n=1 Tax=Zingiber officinale TaxID=94328 RepID=UPI001C4CC0F5|nr:uncharacterized protein LOC121976874 [Zingiber officinale]
MEKDSSFSRGSEMSLLEQFEGILEGDKLIDEIGFLGPSQFASLDQDLSEIINWQSPLMCYLICTLLLACIYENSDHLLEDEILKHTKALLILSCNFSSAWNDRWIHDSRDQYTKERLDSVIDQYTKRLDSVTTVLF